MAPKFKSLKQYCEKDNWELFKNTDHWYFRKILEDGTILHTKVSHSVSKEIPKVLWEKILKKQLMIPEAEFWEKLK
jgi:hypothetical protein